MPLSLHHRKLCGDGNVPVVFLHGLLGSSRNWVSVARLMSEVADVYALDARNHGESPHSDEMNYDVMSADVIDWLEQTDLGPVVLVGHSMGGKTAMRVAVDRPDLIDTLVVVDMAPRLYEPRWEREFRLMRALPVETYRSRNEAEAALEADIPDWAFRKFLTTNLERAVEGPGFRWVVNLPVLEAALPQLFQNSISEGGHFNGRCRFIRGENSGFVKDSDLDEILNSFPEADLITVAKAGHNVHFDQPEAFLRALEPFIG